MKNADLGARAPNPRPRRRRTIVPRPSPEIDDALGTPQSVIDARPVVYQACRCRVCGCTEDHACDLGAGFVCWWIDAAHTLCSAPRCVAVVPLAELEQEQLTHAGDFEGPW